MNILLLAGALDATRTRLRLPLDGRLLVWDGHDFYSHRPPGNGTVASGRDGVSEESSGGFSIDEVRKNGMVIFRNTS